MKKELLLVGSVPLDTPEEVFRTCSKAIGHLVPALPDGESVDRSLWIIMLAYRVFHGHPEIETIKRPPLRNGVENWRPANREESWHFRVKKGVDAVRFGEPGWRLGYAKDAIGSYFIFKTLRQEGVIPKEVRFQVSLPITNSSIDFFFNDPADYPRVKPGFAAALRAEIAKMLEYIPAEDLAIQWDCCIELMDLEGDIPWAPKENKLERHLAQIPDVAAQIPSEVMLGYHLCYGTLGGWPMATGQNLNHAVAFANGAVERSGRRVDFVHIPILETTEERYFAPLKDLKVGKADIYLGAVHDLRDKAAFTRRLAVAKKFVPEFGLAAPCGFGRHPSDELPGVLKDHLTALEILHGLKT
jgi:hypothetical protein